MEEKAKENEQQENEQNKSEEGSEQEEIFKIPIEDLFSEFKEHLDIEGNSRILFSGKFGIGKTYFLNDFFKKHEDEYEFFHLYPVNYQICSNEDIIDFLKYDILIELLKKCEKREIDIFEEKGDKGIVGDARLLFQFIGENFTTKDILRKGVEYICDVADIQNSLIPTGVPSSKVISKLRKPFNDVLLFDEKFQKHKKGEKGLVEEFKKKIRDKNILEPDIFSYLLKGKIKQLKEDKKSVLILDDLERIDPEHIFRILNVFSSHFDLKNEKENRFGFDRVIIVCDYANLKSIFHHRYGENTDACGYFDKFYTAGIFEFDNKEIILQALQKIISKIKVGNREVSKSLGLYGNYINIIVSDILDKAINIREFNLRKLLAGVNVPLSFLNSEKEALVDNPYFHINISCELLISSLGSKNDFIKILQKIKINLSSLTINQENYNLFSYFILNKVMGLVVKDVARWKNYSVYLKNGDIGKIEIDDNNIKEPKLKSAELFYDLLIEYIYQDKYKEKLKQFT